MPSKTIYVRKDVYEYAEETTHENAETVGKRLAELAELGKQTEIELEQMPE